MGVSERWPVFFAIGRILNTDNIVGLLGPDGSRHSFI
jgi:hypothetical protein